MLTEVCQYLRNWFPRSQLLGTFTISDGVLQPTYDAGYEYSNIPIRDGQYFRIIGSDLNDGVYLYPASGLRDEVFNGSVWTMAVPQALLDIVTEIEAWQSKYGGADSEALSPFNSESFGGYSYTKSGSSADGSGTSWKSTFAYRLLPWRKI